MHSWSCDKASLVLHAKRKGTTRVAYAKKKRNLCVGGKDRDVVQARRSGSVHDCVTSVGIIRNGRLKNHRRTHLTSMIIHYTTLQYVWTNSSLCQSTQQMCSCQNTQQMCSSQNTQQMWHSPFDNDRIYRWMINSLHSMIGASKDIPLDDKLSA